MVRPIEFLSPSVPRRSGTHHPRIGGHSSCACRKPLGVSPERLQCVRTSHPCVLPIRLGICTSWMPCCSLHPGRESGAYPGPESMKPQACCSSCRSTDSELLLSFSCVKCTARSRRRQSTCTANLDWLTHRTWRFHLYDKALGMLSLDAISAFSRCVIPC